MIVTRIFLRCGACEKWAIKPGMARVNSGCRHGWYSRAANFESVEELHLWAYEHRWYWSAKHDDWLCPPCGRKQANENLTVALETRCLGCGELKEDDTAHGAGWCI